LNIVAALGDDRTGSGSPADYRPQHGAFSAADDRAEYRSRTGADAAAFGGFLSLAVAFGGAFGVNLYDLAVLILDRLQVSGKIVASSETLPDRPTPEM